MTVEVVLFPGRVKPAGELEKFPLLSLPDQMKVPSWACTKGRVLFPVAPVAAFQPN